MCYISQQVTRQQEPTPASSNRSSVVDEKQIVLDVVWEISRELSPHHPRPQPSTELEVELGLGSLERLELVKRLETRLGRSIEEHPIFTARFVSDLLVELSEEEELEPVTLRPRSLPPLLREAQSLLEALAYQTEQQGTQAAFVLLEQEREAALPTYAELLVDTRKISAGLQALGVKPGDKVAIMLPTSVDFFTAFFGILNAGAVAVPLYPPMRLDQFEDFLGRQDAILKNCQARVLITLPQFGPVAEVMRQRTNLIAITSTRDLAKSAPVPLYPATEHELALLQYTSGSTGNPKGVPLTHRNLLTNIWAIGTGFGIGDGDVMVSWLPLYHDMGLIGMSLVSFVHGNPLVLMAPDQFLSRPVRWLRAFSRYKGSMTAAPNFAYAICAKKIEDKELEGVDLSSWRVALNGAEPVIPATVRAFNKRFGPYGFRETSAFPAYGLAEATLAVSFTPRDQGLKVLSLNRETLAQTGEVIIGEDEVASCGFLVDDIEVRIADDSGPLPEGRQGHVELRGPSMMTGYLGYEPSPEWLRVGDLGFFWEGELYITGRHKDLIVVGGRNIHPNDLEAAVGQLSGVRPGSVAALGIEADGTQKIVVLAEVRKQSPELRSLIQSTVHDVAAVPAEVVMLEPRTLPKTPSGKIRRQESKQRYLENKLRPSKITLSSFRHAAGAWSKATPGKLKHGLRGAWSWFWMLKCWTELVVLKRPAGASIRSMLKRLGIQLKVSGQPFGGGPLMVVANHASLMDGLILVAAWQGESLKFAIADRTARHPMVRAIAREHVIVRRGLGEAAGALEKLTESLNRGECLAVFPEGGIEFSSGLRGFASGAFQAAAAAGARLQPVAISGSRQVLAQGEAVPYPGVVEVKFLDVMESQVGDFQEAASLSQKARAVIAAELPEHCWETRLSRQD